MSKLPVISGQQCVKALRKIGFEVRSQAGSHMILVQTNTKKRISVPDHKTLAKGTDKVFPLVNSLSPQFYSLASSSLCSTSWASWGETRRCRAFQQCP